MEWRFDDGSIDLGLPSGTKWAKANMDASQPNGFAASPYQYECSFLSWGNVIGHNPINESTFDYTFDDTNYALTSGSNLTGNIPVNATYDIARAICGGDWRLPTYSEFQELIDNCDCVQADGITVITENNKFTTIDGIVGVYFKSKLNGNLLFLPACGVVNGTAWSYKTTLLDYWSNEIGSSTEKAVRLDVANYGIRLNEGNRWRGQTCRPVK